MEIFMIMNYAHCAYKVTASPEVVRAIYLSFKKFYETNNIAIRAQRCMYDCNGIVMGYFIEFI